MLGDNGAGKSTFIKILSGVHRHDEGELLVDGRGDALQLARARRKERGIATVFQDLATVPLMSIWRNFFLGSEPTKGTGPLRRIDVKFAQETMVGELRKMGIDVRDPDQPVGTLSGGERQAVAIARAVYFGAKVLILDEPTSALGVKQSGVVLRYVAQARDRGLGVIFITHNPHHAYPVGDRFVILNRGRLMGDWRKARDHPRRARQADVRRRRARRARRTSSAARSTSRRHRDDRCRHVSGAGHAGAARRRVGIGLIGFGWLGQAHSRSMLRIPTLFAERDVRPRARRLRRHACPRAATRRSARSASRRGAADWRAVIDDPRRRRRLRRPRRTCSTSSSSRRRPRPASTCSARSRSAARPSRRSRAETRRAARGRDHRRRLQLPLGAARAVRARS